MKKTLLFVLLALMPLMACGQGGIVIHPAAPDAAFGPRIEALEARTNAWNAAAGEGIIEQIDAGTGITVTGGGGPTTTVAIAEATMSLIDGAVTGTPWTLEGYITAPTATNIAQAIVAPYTNHQDRVDNPHGVTAAQVGALASGDNVSELVNDAGYLTSYIRTLIAAGDRITVVTNTVGDEVTYTVSADDQTQDLSGYLLLSGGTITGELTVAMGVDTNVIVVTGAGTAAANGVYELVSASTFERRFEKADGWNILIYTYNAEDPEPNYFADLSNPEMFLYYTTSIGSDIDKDPALWSWTTMEFGADDPPTTAWGSNDITLSDGTVTADNYKTTLGGTNAITDAGTVDISDTIALAAGAVPQARTVTINDVTQTLSSNLVFTIAEGGTTDHAALSNLAWHASEHTLTANRIAGSDGTGAAAELPYDEVVSSWTDRIHTIPVVSGTATIERVTGYVEYSLALTGTTYLTIDGADFPTNGVSTLSLNMDRAGNTLSFDTNGVFSAFAFHDWPTNGWHRGILSRGYNQTEWEVR